MAKRAAKNNRRRSESDRQLGRPAILSARVALTIGSLSLAGAAISVYLTYVHHLQLGADAAWRSLCEVSDTLSCDAVVSSSYGAIAGVPLSALGVWFYAIVGVLAGIGARSRRGTLPRSPAVCLFLAGCFATVLSLALAAVSVLQIGALCPLCVALYAINVAMLAAGWIAVRATGEGLYEALTAEGRRWRRHRGRAVLSGGAALSLLAVVAGLSTRSGRSAVCEAAVSAAKSGSPITLVIYVDFQCPHCGVLHRDLRPFRADPRLRTILRHYPLEPSCNRRVRRAGHGGACLQAHAAICAADQGREEDFIDRLFDDGPKDRRGLTNLATALGLERTKFVRCLESEDSQRLLYEDIEGAIAKGVRGTPTVFADGRRHAGPVTAEDLTCLRRLLDAPTRAAQHSGALKRASSR